MGIDLPLIWAAIIVFGVMMYVLLDGFDLGIGILFPFVADGEERDVMMNTIAPVWDGNETWLVLGGAGLFAAFPMAYGILLSALYLPLILMLIGLILRGVAFEFRFKASPSHRPVWDFAFTLGSLCATFFQGVAIGSFINGFNVENGQFAGGAFDWFTPFSIFTGVGLIAAYALLGSTWLVMKAEGRLNAQMAAASTWTMVALLLAITIVSMWTPFAHPRILERWFSLPNIFFFWPVPILVALTATLLQACLKRGRQVWPFVLALFMLFLGYSGLAISMWPYIVPPVLTFRDAAAPPESMGFALVGTLFIMPIITAYTAWSYYVFRGKVSLGEGYH